MRTHSVNSNALAFKLFRNKKTLNLLTYVVQIHFININNSLYRAKIIPKIFGGIDNSSYLCRNYKKMRQNICIITPTIFLLEYTCQKEQILFQPVRA